MLRNWRKHFVVLILTGLFFTIRPSGFILQEKAAAQSGTVTRYELILAMNTLRVSNGLPALIEDPIVNAVAQVTAETMAANNMSWHIGDVRGRLAAAGYGGGATVWATENFAVGNMSIDRIMQVWADPDHMRPAVTPAYCHVGAGVAQAANGQYYYVLQAAYISGQVCGEYKSVTGDPDVPLPVPQIIIPVTVATPDSDDRVYHIVKSGQSFWSIAIAYQITIQDLEEWNNLYRDNGLYVGQKLFIPTSSTEGYATPTPVGMVIPATPDAKGITIHEVQPYQVLIRIADAYQVTVDRILALNGLNIDWPLQIGQKLLIDEGKTTPGVTSQPLSAIEKLTPDSDGNYYHTIKSGENLTTIAKLYEVTLPEILAWNGLTSDSVIRPGERLYLRVTPPATNTPTPVPPSTTLTPVPPTQRTPTPTQTINTQPSATKTASVEPTNGSSGMRALVIVPVIGGLILVGWLVWRRFSTRNPQ